MQVEKEETKDLLVDIENTNDQVKTENIEDSKEMSSPFQVFIILNHFEMIII